MELPADAIFLNQTKGSQYKLYRFPDGQLHDLTRQSVMLKASSGLQKIGKRGVGLHVRHHVNRGIKGKGCKLCFPQGENNAGEETGEGTEETQQREPILITAQDAERRTGNG